MSDTQRSSIPDTLFKYVNAEGGLATLKDSTVSIMFSKPSDLNDPFEFLPSLDGLPCDPAALTLDCRYLVSPFLSATADYMRQEVELHWFVTSLTSADRNVRMWAQYAVNHTGIKFTFNLAEIAIQKDMMERVDYSQPHRTDIRALTEPNATKDDKGTLLKQLATQKGCDWEHEKEIRWFLRDEGGDQVDSHKQSYSKGLVDGKMRAFMKLPHSCIKRVTVGYLSHPSLLRSVLELRKMHRATWEIARSRLSLNSFQFDEDLVNEE